MLKNRLVPCLGTGTFISIRREEDDGVFRAVGRAKFGKVNGTSMGHIVHKVWTTTCCGCAMQRPKKNPAKRSRECLVRILQSVDIYKVL